MVPGPSAQSGESGHPTGSASDKGRGESRGLCRQSADNRHVSEVGVIKSPSSVLDQMV